MAKEATQILGIGKTEVDFILKKQSLKRYLGYTLIEIMVVLAVTSIVLGLTLPNLQFDERQQLQEEGRRLGLLLSHASVRASSTGQAIGWMADRNQYGFYQYLIEKNDWELIQGADTLRVRHLPDNLLIKTINIGGQLAQKKEMIVFSSSGINAAFSITIYSTHARVSVRGDLIGKVTVSEVEEIS